MKKIFSIFLCFVMIISAFSESALLVFAEGESNDGQDIAVRQEYDCYKNDFETVSGNGLVIPEHLSSSATDGALKIEPNDTNIWKLNPDIDVPNQLILSFRFMLPEPLTKGERIMLFYDKTASDYLIKIMPSAEKLLASMNVGNDLMTFRMEHNQWYKITVVMTPSATIVYCNNSFLGSTRTGYSECVAGNDLFAFNYQANDNAKTYYIDDLLVSTVIDDAFAKLVSYQKTNAKDGKYNLRFILSLSDIFECEELVGYEIHSDTNKKDWDLTARDVYTSITSGFGTKTTPASDLGGKYLATGTILNIPAEIKTVDFVVTSYVKIMDIKIYASSVTVVITSPKTIS